MLALLLSFALEYAIRKAHENHEGLKLNKIYKLMNCVDVTSMVKTWYLRKNTKALLCASKEFQFAVEDLKFCSPETWGNGGSMEPPNLVMNS